LSEVCWKLGEALRGIRPIAIEVQADAVVTNSQKATRIGLIVNELVSNALKHAFRGDSAGTVAVKLGGDMTRESASPGCRIIIAIPPAAV
jgi:two-component sensor histidine kinase